MPELSITIPGRPIAKKRPKFFRRGGFVGAYNCQETEEGRFMQQLSMQRPENWQPIEGAISLSVAFLMPIPESSSKKKREAMARGEIRHIKKPDVDNMIKFVKDCANGILWRDDSQVFNIWANKLYAKNPQTHITIAWEE